MNQYYLSQEHSKLHYVRYIKLIQKSFESCEILELKAFCIYKLMAFVGGGTKLLKTL